MKSQKQIKEKYNELAHLKTIIVKERETMDRESFYLRIQDVNAKLSTIDWLFNDNQDIY